jgi:hypothetical protein
MVAFSRQCCPGGVYEGEEKRVGEEMSGAERSAPSPKNLKVVGTRAAIDRNMTPQVRFCPG